MSFTRVTGERFMRETTLAFDFPYCSRCVEHSHQWNVAWNLSGRTIAAGAVACAIIGLAAGPLVGAVAIVLAIAAAVGVGFARRAKARASCCPSCVTTGAAVTYHGWTGDVQTFSFASGRYGSLFAEQNERRLVNVTAHMSQFLEDRAIAEPPPALPARMPRATMPLPITPQPAETGPAIPWPQRVERPRVLDYLAQLEPSAVAGVVVAKRPG